MLVVLPEGDNRAFDSFERRHANCFLTEVWLIGVPPHKEGSNQLRVGASQLVHSCDPVVTVDQQATTADAVSYNRKELMKTLRQQEVFEIGVRCVMVDCRGIELRSRKQKLLGV